MRRSTSLVLAVFLMAGALTAIGASPAAACRTALRQSDVFSAMRDKRSMDAGIVRANSSGGMETLSLLTFDLEVADVKPVYAIGDTVSINVTVTRPAKEDPLGNGIAMDRPYVEPVPGVIVGSGLYVGRVFLPGAAMTDEKGVAHIRIKLENYAPRGKRVDTSVYAWKVVQESACASVQEYGYRSLPGHFKTAP